ncbi:GNAT family N-acetyltransferase [Actinacidiphila epipremni]|uniref:GNAT family N-acetyltransferase n=1 Tax=Actinacidiphila epipremni TaxID=2053013 RepID=A0ABX0ZLH5_9ACTN|nr:GNAT family protein [Actinacidiphila epipremni]NJP44718.1 GNAT family N-acetyltransferase [Actinacidiphila epipremni]
MSEPHILLDGDRLALSLPRQDMLPTYHRWENHPGTVLGYGTQMPQSWETRSAGWQGQAGSPVRTAFEVVRREDMRAVGMTVLYVDQAVRTSEYVMLIAPEERGKGYATEATRLTLDWAFRLGAVRMVWLKVLAPNGAAVRAYGKAGFRDAGRLRNSGYWLGQPVDELLMDALPEDFVGPSAVTAAIGS